jgi:DNA-binding CsgD family transcriptional regulator
MEAQRKTAPSTPSYLRLGPTGDRTGNLASRATALVAALEEALVAARGLLAAAEAGQDQPRDTATDRGYTPAKRRTSSAGDAQVAADMRCAALDVLAADSDHAALVELSSREAEVLRLLARGHTDREIAAALNLSTRTVSNHVARIRARVRAENRTTLAALALRLGLA